MKRCRDEQCRRKRRLLSESEFYVNQFLKSGLTAYCKECTKRRVYGPRRAKAAAKKAEKLNRKPDVIARPDPLSLVERAIANGWGTREQIQRHTRLTMDDVVDALAVLSFEQGVVRIKKAGDDWNFYLKRAA